MICEQILLVLRPVDLFFVYGMGSSMPLTAAHLIRFADIVNANSIVDVCGTELQSAAKLA